MTNSTPSLHLIILKIKNNKSERSKTRRKKDRNYALTFSDSWFQQFLKKKKLLCVIWPFLIFSVAHHNRFNLPTQYWRARFFPTGNNKIKLKKSQGSLIFLENSKGIFEIFSSNHKHLSRSFVFSSSVYAFSHPGCCVPLVCYHVSRDQLFTPALPSCRITLGALIPENSTQNLATV